MVGISPRFAASYADPRLRDAGVTVPTVRKILATLHGALEYAISQDWTATNAAHGIRVIGPRDEGYRGHVNNHILHPENGLTRHSKTQAFPQQESG
jgi:hypothetical protein